MNKKTFLITLTIISLALSASASAQETENTAGNDNPAAAPNVPNINLKNIKNRFKEGLNQFRSNTAVKKEEIKNTLKTEVENRRAALEKNIAVKKEELREKLTAVKDERKKAAIENIETKFHEINTRLTQNFARMADRMEELLNRIENKSQALKEKNIDVTASENAILKAKSVLETARAAITAQAEKIYSVADVITAENKAKQNIGDLRKKIGDDLKTVKKSLDDAKQAIIDALKSIPNSTSQATSTDVTN